MEMVKGNETAFSFVTIIARATQNFWEIYLFIYLLCIRADVRDYE